MFTLATSNARTNFPLSPKKILKKTIAKALVLPWAFLILAGMLYPLILIIDKSTGINGILIVSLTLLFLYIATIVFSYIYESWYFQTYYYELTENFILIKKGVLATKEITIPYERIQDVYVDQDILDRMFGLFDVHLSSATISSSWLAHIDGVETLAATGLKEALLQKLQQKKPNNGPTTSQ